MKHCDRGFVVIFVSVLSFESNPMLTIVVVGVVALVVVVVALVLLGRICGGGSVEQSRTNRSREETT
jgi:high-affinity Fe2+/Pb2+ permease